MTLFRHLAIAVLLLVCLVVVVSVVVVVAGVALVLDTHLPTNTGMTWQAGRNYIIASPTDTRTVCPSGLKERIPQLSFVLSHASCETL